jgi:hypothetical protein
MFSVSSAGSTIEQLVDLWKDISLAINSMVASSAEHLCKTTLGKQEQSLQHHNGSKDWVQTEQWMAIILIGFQPQQQQHPSTTTTTASPSVLYAPCGVECACCAAVNMITLLFCGLF